MADGRGLELRKVIEAGCDVVDPSEIEFDAPDDGNKMDFLSECFEQCHVRASGNSAMSRSVGGGAAADRVLL